MDAVKLRGISVSRLSDKESFLGSSIQLYETSLMASIAAVGFA